MLDDRTKEFKVESTMQGEDIAMQIDLSEMGFIMTILTDLYSDREMAIIREYSTNAWDAHVEIGNTQPIEVWTPTALSPFLKIRDYGIGLTAQDIRSIYSQYGASTKRSTNDQTGMLGLGCKSGLAYANQFTVTSVKDGQKIAILVTRAESGGGVMKKVYEGPTTEHSGTEISIPTATYNDIQAKAATFFSYWNPEHVLLDGKPPVVTAAGRRITDNIFLTIDKDLYSYGKAESTVVMGGVPYPVENSRLGDFPSTWKFTIWAPIGSVNFVPSREMLDFTTKTIAYLESLRRPILAGLEAAVEGAVDEAETKPEAIAKLAEWRELLTDYSRLGYGRSRLDLPTQWRGIDIPDASVDDACMTLPKESYRPGKRSTCAQRSLRFSHSEMFIEGYDMEVAWSAGKRKKLEAYITQNAVDVSGISGWVVCEKLTNPDWIDPVRVLQWDDIKDIKVPRQRSTRYGSNASKGRPDAAYDIYKRGSAWQVGITADLIDTSKPIYYMENGGSLSAYDICRVLDSMHDDEYTLVPLQARRKAKFLRLFPKAVNASQKVREGWKMFKDSLTEQQRKALAVDSCLNKTKFRNLNSAKIDDPVLREVVDLAKMDIDDVSALMNTYYYMVDSEGKRCRIDLPSVDNPLKKYPLFDSYQAVHPHTYIYLNAAYAAESEDKDS